MHHQLTAQRRERDLDPGPRTVHADQLDNPLATAHRRRSMAIGKAPEPAFEAARRNRHRPHGSRG
jgi:hypothetical protein